MIIAAKSIGGRKPKRQVIHHAREEAGLGGAQEKSLDVELRRPLNESRRCGEHRPQHHDREHETFCTDAREHNVGRQLKERVTQEQKACPETEHGGCKAQILVHRERRESGVHPVEEIGE
jgi:hypothetical protein